MSEGGSHHSLLPEARKEKQLGLVRDHRMASAGSWMTMMSPTSLALRWHHQAQSQMVAVPPPTTMSPLSLALRWHHQCWHGVLDIGGDHGYGVPFTLGTCPIMPTALSGTWSILFNVGSTEADLHPRTKLTPPSDFSGFDNIEYRADPASRSLKAMFGHLTEE